MKEEIDWDASPPPGWFPFGTHIDTPGQLEFLGQAQDGMPLWERPSRKASQQFPYVSPSHIRVSEEFVSSDGLMRTYRVWTASIDSKSFSIDPYRVGPVIVMDRRGNTANEAYAALVEAIEAEGFMVERV